MPIPKRTDKKAYDVPKKKCTSCKQLLELWYFNRSPSGKMGVNSQCKECVKKNRNPTLNEIISKNSINVPGHKNNSH